MENNEGQPTAENVCQNSAEPDIHLSKDEIITKLWNIIDDIDTYGDMAKSDDAAFRRLVEKRQKDRWKTGVTTDGFTLQIPQENDPGRAVLKFLPTLTDGTALSFLSHWSAGNFKLCRKEWPEAPEECYIGADSLHKEPKSSKKASRTFGYTLTLPLVVDQNSDAFNEARGIMGTADGLQDATLKRAIEAYAKRIAEKNPEEFTLTVSYDKDNHIVPDSIELSRGLGRSEIAKHMAASLKSTDQGLVTTEIDQRLANAQLGKASMIAAIEFSLSVEDGTGLNFLQFWRKGDFDACRAEWPDAPAQCYYSQYVYNGCGVHWSDKTTTIDGSITEHNSTLDVVFAKRLRRKVRGLSFGAAVQAAREDFKALNYSLGYGVAEELLTRYVVLLPLHKACLKSARLEIIEQIKAELDSKSRGLTVGDVPFIKNYLIDVVEQQDSLRLIAEWEEAVSETAVARPFGIGRNGGHKVEYVKRSVTAEYKEQGDAQ